MSKRNMELMLFNELRTRKKMELSEAIALLGVSESTVRRVFSKLEANKKVFRIHGGVKLIEELSPDYSFETLVKDKFNEKMAIGRLALSAISDGDVIYIDAGTTLLSFCISIVESLKTDPINIKIFTNSFVNLEILAAKIPVTVVGGDFRANRKDFCGFIAEKTVSQLHFSKCFLGADGFKTAEGFTTTDFDTARLNQITINHSDSTIILCDSSKFEKSSLVSNAKISQIDTVFTDAGIRKEILEQFVNEDVTVKIASI